MTDVILAAIILAPAAVTFLLKSNAALGFLALCLGFVLSTSVIGDLKNLLSQMDLTFTDSSIALTVLIAPILLSLLFSHGSASSGMKLYLQLIVAVCAGSLLALSLDPVLNLQASDAVGSSMLWQGLQNFQSVIIGAGGLLSLLLVWKKPSHKKKH